MMNRKTQERRLLVETKLLNLLIRNLEQRTGRLLLKRDRLMARLERLQRKREAKWLHRFSRPSP